MKLYNTMSKRIEEFKPIKENEVSMYACGPTVYNYAHIGNLRTYIFEDILKRALMYFGYNVKHVMNVTDVGHLASDSDTGDDKMELGALREGKSIWDLAGFYWDAFKSDIRQLNIIEPDIWCRATDHIAQQINMVAALEAAGYTYRIEDGVYFDTSKLSDYGKLAKLNIEGLKAGSRVDMVSGKRNITDFALWKFSPTDKKRLMEWDSPWGIGFPGWHIECSAMAMEYLGDEIDIHCGGVDHIPIHHTNEIAQVESLTGKQWVKYWLHGEFLVLDNDEKMSKSGENFSTLSSLTKAGIDPLTYRYFCLNASYRKQLTYRWDAIQAAEKSYGNLKEAMVSLKKSLDVKKEPVINKKYNDIFKEAISSDLNIPKALGIMWNLIKDGNLADDEKYWTAVDMDRVFGLGLNELEESVGEEIIPDEIKEIAEERARARKEKNWALSDKLRDKMNTMGFTVEDTAEGQKVKKR